MDMPLSPSWTEISLRLALTMLAGTVIGFNRGARGHAAGFRTTILVCLAASVAMIQTNVLLPVSGKTPQSFAVMDLMRLPLGILTGVGFIGGGAILKKGELVTGVTTAATLWVVTVIGLCLGGGQLVLGTAATILADLAIPREHRAMMVVSGAAESDIMTSLPRLTNARKYHAYFRRQTEASEPGKAEYSFEISWRRAERAAPPLDLMDLIRSHYAIKSFELTSDIGR